MKAEKGNAMTIGTVVFSIKDVVFVFTDDESTGMRVTLEAARRLLEAYREHGSVHVIVPMASHFNDANIEKITAKIADHFQQLMDALRAGPEAAPMISTQTIPSEFLIDAAVVAVYIDDLERHAPESK